MSAAEPLAVELKRRIVELARRASLEVTPGDESLAATLATHLAPDTVVYVAHTPSAKLDDVVRVATKVQAAGLHACPHVAARRIVERRELEAAVHALADAGVTRALVIAGDNPKPAGEFASALDVLRTGILNHHGITRIGVAGHPEGHRAIGQAQLWSALAEKQALAARLNLNVYMVTQFGFDPAALVRWERHLAEHGITLPVYVGMAGPASLPALIRYAMQCGVGASLRGVLHGMQAMRNVAGHATTPDRMLTGILEAAGDDAAHLAGIHLYSFGGVVASARWIRAVAEGRFDLHPSLDRFTLRE